MARHRKPDWLKRNNASLSTAALVATLLSMVLSALTGASPYAHQAAASSRVMVVVSNVDIRPPSSFELRHVSFTPVADILVQTTARQTSVRTQVIIESGSNLTKKAAELGGDWNADKLCEHTIPALTDCDVVPAGTVIELDGPTHALPIVPIAQLAPVPVAKTAVAAPASAPVQASHPAPPVVSNPNGSNHQALMAAAGIAPSDYQWVDKIVSHESGWCVTVMNAERGCPAFHGVLPHKAYGLPQALPGNKMAAFGADWETNPVTQLKWADWYAHAVYGSWSNAWAHWDNNKWW